MKCTINKYGYLHTSVSMNNRLKEVKIHKAVAMAFLGHIPCGLKLVVNHKNFNRIDNRKGNLETVTFRENTNQKHLKSSSKFTGVSWDKERNKWAAKIYINKKHNFLGRFNSEIEASNAYEKALNNIK